MHNFVLLLDNLVSITYEVVAESDIVNLLILLAHSTSFQNLRHVLLRMENSQAFDNSRN